MARYVSFRDFDWLLLGFVLLICGIGVTEIYSATLHTKFAGAHIKQIYWILGGVVLMFAVSLINYQAMLEQVHWMYIASIASLMLVLVFGQKYLGARRWVKIGGNHFQPSEWTFSRRISGSAWPASLTRTPTRRALANRAFSRKLLWDQEVSGARELPRGPRPTWHISPCRKPTSFSPRSPKNTDL